MAVLSKKKINEIIKEIEQLTSEREPLLAQIKEARELGDLSENAEYIESKKKLTENNMRYNKLNNILSNAHVEEDSNKINKDYVDIFATVELEDLEDKYISKYTIVEEEEESVFEDKISITSPVGKQLKNKKKNDTIEVVLNKKTKKYKIKDLYY